MVGADRQQQLGVGEQGADLAFLLVAQVLADGFLVGQAAVFRLQVGAFALDDRQGDAVDEADDVGAAGLVRAFALDGEFFRDVINVVFGVFPVDVTQRVVAGIAVMGLGQGDAQREQVVEAFVGAHQPIVETHFADAADGLGDGVFAEGMLLTFDAVAVVGGQPLFEHARQDNVPFASTAQTQRLLRR